MLKSRLLTAIVLIAFVVGVIFFAPSIIFLFFMAVFMGIAAWEWGGLVPFKPVKMNYWRWFYVILIEAGLFFMSSEISSVSGVHALFWMNNGVLIAALVALLTYPKTQKYWHYRVIIIVFGGILLVTAGISLKCLKQMPHGIGYLMSLLLLTWAADTGAYFSGRFLGKRKFSPAVSPNKTWAGFWGGVLLGEVVVIVAGFGFAANTLGWFYWIMTGSLSILGAVMGDLLISLLKRCVNLKDTGNILPGHGGVLDRIDSLLVSSSVMAFFLVERWA